MTDTVPLRCTCGAVRGTASGVTPAARSRNMCYCDDCQTFAHYLGRADEVLDANGGTEAFALTPSQVTIIQGADKVRCVKLGPKGLNRFYADCCKTPIANAPSAKIPMAIVIRNFIDLDNAGITREFGPMAGRIMARFAHGILPPDAHDKAPLGFLLRAGGTVFRAWIGGKGQPSPFFDAAGQHRVPVHVLEKNQRQELHARVPAPHGR